MPIFTKEEVPFVEAVSRLIYCNPFLPERIQYEREALGREFVEIDSAWNLRPELEEYHINVVKIMERSEALIVDVRKRLASGKRFSGKESGLYLDLALFVLYHRYSLKLDDTIKRAAAHGGERISYYDSFRKDAEGLLSIPEINLPKSYTTEHIFAIFYQIRRGFHHIFNYILGGSGPVVRLRASVWQSVFTHDLRRYSTSLYDKMGDITTLISGPSGTGKELVARAIAHSRYIPFDAAGRRFVVNYPDTFHPLNISALSPTLVESELFGHRKGAFTGADAEKQGWLEGCGPYGTVFLDEIGDVDASIQVKLLRVLQTRGFSRLGETKIRRFEGKIIAATNRDLSHEMEEGKFRQDFYYRLCSDIVTTPSLHQQISESPGDLSEMVGYIAKRIVGDDSQQLASDVMEWISKRIGMDYPWPGNIRELEQCVRNIMIRRDYNPPPVKKAGKSRLEEALNDTGMSADQLLDLYASIVYSKTKSYEETARRLNLDRRTVKKRVADLK